MLEQKRNRYRFDIRSLAADCEANYQRLVRLLGVVSGGMQAGEAQYRSASFQIRLAAVQSALLELRIVEVSRYTVHLDVAISVANVGDYGLTLLSVRLYHDAKMAEVIACNRQRSPRARYTYPNDRMFQPDEKVQQNRLLTEWLTLCLAQGLVVDQPFDAGGQATPRSTLAATGSAPLPTDPGPGTVVR